jgi:trimeric autotransporter adhesin
MKRMATIPYLLTAFVSISCPAYGQQPPDPVPSDNVWDTAVGGGALQSLQPLNPGPGSTDVGAHDDTAVGAYALFSTTIGDSNTAVGSEALTANTTGCANTAIGVGALSFNTTGCNNTAAGISALQGNTTGKYNVATGSGALDNNSTGNENTGNGLNALYSNLIGSRNTGSGSSALFNNTTGSYNTATGYQSLYSNTTGYRNEASGSWALQFNTIGHDNTASGQGALLSNTSGSYNVGLGQNAGYYVTTGSANIEIGNVGTAADHNIIRIGTAGSQTATYIAGIQNTKVTGSAVYITSTGQLGVLASSQRYKISILPMGDSSEKLRQLRPVTFHLKTDPKGPVQYGLIAEQVAKVYPELVIRDETGRVQGVHYEELAPMLLNEAQRQRKQIAAQAAEIDQLKAQLQRIDTALVKLQSKDDLVAKR